MTDQTSVEDRLRRALTTIASQPIPAAPPTFRPVGGSDHRRPTRTVGVALIVVAVAAAVALALVFGPHSGIAKKPPPVPTPATTPTSPATSSRLTAITFFRHNRGYGLFTRDGDATCRDLVGSTSDGGRQFSQLVQATSWNCASASGNPANSVAFDDHGDGFLYGPGLYVTYDGGKKWTPHPQHGTVLSVEALGSSVWMVESGCFSTSSLNSCPLRLFKSTDGGHTWSSSSTTDPPFAVVNPSSGEEGGQSWLVRVSQSSAYILSSPLMGTGPPGTTYNAPMWFTANGGRSWANRSIPCPIPSNSALLSLAPNSTLIAVCASQPSAGNQEKSVLSSSNEGATWTVTSSCSGSGCNKDPLTPGYVGGIDAASADTVYLYGERSSLRVSHDGGAQWQTVHPLIGDDAGGSEQAVFFNPSDGIVLAESSRNGGAPTLWTTRDGGTSWKTVVPGSG
jgi:photosystem II stability/assembly factor-like uncharacterized protein